VRLADRDALRLGAPSGSTWLRFEGVREIDGERIAATAIYILSAIGARAEDFRGTKRAFTEEVEKRYGVGVAAITQTIRAELLTGNDAAALKAPAGSPILRTVRRYYDAAGRLFVLSDTRHPAERFSYEMSFRRQSSPDTQMTPLSRSRRRSAAE
jgi:DNA-binding GntR family transcriptional regulator